MVVNLVSILFVYLWNEFLSANVSIDPSNNECLIIKLKTSLTIYALKTTL